MPEQAPHNVASERRVGVLQKSMVRRLLNALVCLAACGQPASPHIGADGALSIDAAVSADAALPSDAQNADAVVLVDAVSDAAADASPGVANMVVDTSPIDFGAADIGQRLSYLLTVENTGTAGAYVSLSITGDRQIFSSTTSMWVAAGSMNQTYISFLTYATGQFTATLALTSGTWGQTISARGESYTALHVGKWGQGTVVGPSFSCASARCDTRFVKDITLMAVPDAGHQFVAWSDRTCGTQLTCTVHQEAIGRAVEAYFAPQSSSLLTITLAGTGNGVVKVEDQSFGNAHVATCSTSCQVPIQAGAPIRVTAESLSRVVGISGACSGGMSCTFTSNGSTSLTATFERDAKELWSRSLEYNAARGVSYDSQGNLLVLTDYTTDEGSQLIKLDSTGKTLWAHPGVEGAEVRVGVADWAFARGTDTAWVYDSDGYLVGAHQFSTVDPINYYDEPHFVRRLVTTTNDHRALVGNKNSVTNVEMFQVGTRIINATSMQVMRGTSALLFFGVGNGAGGMDVRVLDQSGVAQGSITDASTVPGTFDVMPQGDIVSASSTTTAAVLRRKNSTTTAFTHTVPLQYSVRPYVAVVPTSGDRVFWLYSAQSPITNAPNGYIAELVDAAGNVTWSITRPALDPQTNLVHGVEIYAAEGNGTDVALVGAYQSISQFVGGASFPGVVFGEGFVHVFRP